MSLLFEDRRYGDEFDDGDAPSSKSSFSAMDEINKKAMRILAEKKLKNELSEQTAAVVADLQEEEDKQNSLADVLVEKGIISKDQLQVALKLQRASENKQELGEILVDLGFITETALASVFAESSGIASFDLKAAALDVDLIRKIPKSVAIQHKVVPLSLENGVLYIATTDVFNVIAFDQIKKYFDRQIKIVPKYAQELQITDVIDQYYEYEMSVDGILKEIEVMMGKSQVITSDEQGYLNPTVRLVDAIFFDAIKREASDIHFEPENNFVRLRYRIDGKLVQILTFHKDYWPSIVVRIKILASLNIAETRNPQDGRISYMVMGRVVDFRVSVMPVIYGENIVARVLDKSKSLVSLTALGLLDRDLDLVKRLLQRPEGMVVVTGPTGSGKSTTLYSFLSYINAIDINIMTLEDPVEYQIPMIRQSGVKEGTGMNFADGIRSMLRQDPDVILVGEIRDSDTAAMTIRAAMTGHQVFTTLHTNDAISAIPRLMDLGVKPSILAGAIICIIAQRLARKLCSFCKKEHVADSYECKLLGVDPNFPPLIHKHAGCDKCNNTGYKGRVGLFEIFAIDKEIDDMISRNASRKELLSYALSNGFSPIINDATQKVLDGITDLDEVIHTIDMTERMK